MDGEEKQLDAQTIDLLKAICAIVESEYQMGGLSSGIYGDYALEVAKRAVLLERERCKRVADCFRIDGATPDEYEGGLDTAASIISEWIASGEPVDANR